MPTPVTMTARQIRKPKSRLKKRFIVRVYNFLSRLDSSFFLHGRKGRPTGRFNGDNDRAFNKGGNQRLIFRSSMLSATISAVMTALPMSMIKATPSP